MRAIPNRMDVVGMGNSGGFGSKYRESYQAASALTRFVKGLYGPCLRRVRGGMYYWRTDTNLLGSQTTPTLRRLQAHPLALCRDCSGIQKPEVRHPRV